LTDSDEFTTAYQ